VALLRLHGVPRLVFPSGGIASPWFLIGAHHPLQDPPIVLGWGIRQAFACIRNTCFFSRKRSQRHWFDAIAAKKKHAFQMQFLLAGFLIQPNGGVGRGGDVLPSLTKEMP